MSSVPEKQHSVIVANNNKRNFFFRKDSIRKIKCTAMYPFQVAGLKLSNNVIIELIEKNIMKARICIQKALLNFYIVILKLLSTLFTLCDNIQFQYSEIIGKKNINNEVKTNGRQKDAEVNRKMRLQRQQRVEIIDDDNVVNMTKPTENNKNTLNSSKGATPSPSSNIQMKNSYQSRLLAKLERIQKHKTRLNGKSLRLQLSSSTDVEQEDDDEGKKKLNKRNTLLEMNLIKFAASIAKEQLQLQLPQQQQLQQQQQINEKSKLQKYFLILCVHAGLFIMYLQVLVLCLVLNSVQIPIGLLFLIATGTIIGYILIKVSFFHKFSGNLKKSANISKQCSMSDDGCCTSDSGCARQARSTKKRAPMLDIDSKSLSKIKLL